MFKTLRSIGAISFLTVAFLTLLSPKWINVAGVGPCWAVLWLLPWSLEEGIRSSVFAGCLLGLLLDALTVGGPTLIPALMGLGWWWGWLGKYGSKIEGTLNLGLLAWLGSVVCGCSLWIQIFLLNLGNSSSAISHWALQTLFLQSILTALIAPLISAWFLVLLRKRRLQ